MDREELGVALLLAVPVAAGVTLGALKQTLGSQPLVALGLGVTLGAVVFAVVALAVGRSPDLGLSPRWRSLVQRLTPEPREATSTDILLGAGMGALVTVFLWYIPLSPLLGGAAAGFLQGGSREDARTAGTLSGALVPLVALVVAVVAFLVAGAQVFGRFPFGPLVAIALGFLGVVYAVGLGAAGGWLGGLALADERRWGREV